MGPPLPRSTSHTSGQCSSLSRSQNSPSISSLLVSSNLHTSPILPSSTQLLLQNISIIFPISHSPISHTQLLNYSYKILKKNLIFAISHYNIPIQHNPITNYETAKTQLIKLLTLFLHFCIHPHQSHLFITSTSKMRNSTSKITLHFLTTSHLPYSIINTSPIH